MKEQKNLSYSLRKGAHPFKSSLNSMFLPILSQPGAFTVLTNVNYVKNAIFENYFEQFSHFSTVNTSLSDNQQCLFPASENDMHFHPK